MVMENILGNVLGNAAYDAVGGSDILPGNEEAESQRELLASIHRILEKLLSVTMESDPPRRTFYEESITLQPGIESDFNTDARRHGFSQIALYPNVPAPGTANLVLRRMGMLDINVVLPAGKFTTIQQPMGTRWLLKSTDPSASFTVRYSDTVFGAVLP